MTSSPGNIRVTGVKGLQDPGLVTVVGPRIVLRLKTWGFRVTHTTSSILSQVLGRKSIREVNVWCLDWVKICSFVFGSLQTTERVR